MLFDFGLSETSVQFNVNRSGLERNSVNKDDCRVRSSIMDGRKLDRFLGWRATVLKLCLHCTMYLFTWPSMKNLAFTADNNEYTATSSVYS
jgi:hypothetical protein